MEMIIDSSAIIAVIANEPEKAALIHLTKDADLLAPASIYWEIGNAFSAMLKRGRISLDEALAALEIYSWIPHRLVTVDLADSLAIAAQLNIYAYDAYLIVCAQKYKAPLISLDRNLLRAARQIGVEVIEVNL